MKTISKFLYLFILSIAIIGCTNSDDDTGGGDQPDPQYNLDAIQGNWFRVGGNNPNNNGMKINVTNNQGKITESSNSNYPLNSIKWKDIEATAENEYEHLELGSDGLYYDAIMQLGQDDTLRIYVGIVAPGSEQKWVRTYTEPDPEVNDCSPYDAGAFSGDLTNNWSEANEIDEYPGLLPAVSDPAGGYYIVTLTAEESVPWIDIKIPGAPYPIINGSAGGSSTPQTRKVAFLAHPGVSYDVTVNPFINGGNFPETYTINWEYVGLMDCFELNDTFEQAKFIPKNETLEAFANAGYKVMGSSETSFDWYKVRINEPAKIKVEVQQCPSDEFMRMRIFREDHSELTTTTTDIFGNSTNHTAGTLYYKVTNSTLDPGIYYIRFDGTKTGNRQIDYNAEETMPDVWTTPYKFQVTTVQ